MNNEQESHNDLLCQIVMRYYLSQVNMIRSEVVMISELVSYPDELPGHNNELVSFKNEK